MFATLMTTRRFAPLFWCQFFSALNDNFIKNALVILILYQAGAAADDASNTGTLVTLAGVALVIPFFLFSALGGQLADRFDKGRVARHLKLAEIPIAALAAWGFIAQSIPLLFVVLALFGTMAALFGPLKYGTLPEQLSTQELSAGNAFIEGATFTAILLGTVAGGLAASAEGGGSAIAAAIIAMAALGWGSAAMIPRRGPAAPQLQVDFSPLASTFRLLATLRADPTLWRGALIVSWFWLVGMVALSLLPALVKITLNGSEGVVTLFLVLFTIGIAAGSTLAAWLARGQPNLALVPLAAVLMGLFCLDLALALASAAPTPTPQGPATLLSTFGGWRIAFDLSALALAGGLFIVPAFAAVQAWAPEQARARTIAAVNIVNAAFMTAGGIATAVLQSFGVSLTALFAGLGVLTLGVSWLIARAWGGWYAQGAPPLALAKEP
ncbi:MAG: MFS transporter [Pseudomonadota bacterium]